MIIYIHIPKTGGTSIAKSLKDEFGHKGVFVYSGHNPYSSSFVEFVHNSIIPNEAKVIIGHNNSKFYDNISNNVIKCTMLRSPVDQVVSYFYFIKEVIRKEYSSWKKLYGYFLNDISNMGIDDFVDYTPLHNMQSAFIRNPVNSFDFIGIYEDYERSLKLLNKIINTNLVENKLNVGNKKQVDNDLKKRIEKNNKDDMLLYEQGLFMFHDLCMKYEV